MPYTPKPPPRTSPEFQELYDYIEQELQSISRELLESQGLELRTTSKVPLRPREGMIVQADGTDWDPGEGAGTYKYEGGTWKKFGDADHVHTLADITDAGTLAAANSVGTGDISGVDASRIIGRETAGTGTAEQLTLSQVLDFIGSAAQGDLLVRGASAWARLGIGAADTVLQSDGTDPSWQALATGAWELLQSNTPTSGTTSDFTDIAQTHNVLMFLGRNLDFSAQGTLLLKVGTTSAFSVIRSVFIGSLSVASTTVSGSGLASVATGSTVVSQATNDESHFLLAIFDYKSSTKEKLFVLWQGRAQATTVFGVYFGTILTTDPIEHVRFETSTGNYVAGSIDMYGVF